MSEKITDPADNGLSADHYETILRNIHDAVYTLDADGRITWVNEVAVEEFDAGYTRDELIGASVSKILTEEDITKCVEIITDLIRNDERNSGRCEIAIQTAYGDEIPCDIHLTLLPFEDGEFQGTVGVLRDITDRTRREQGRMVLNRVLRHNLRNQLNVIKGHAESLETSTADESEPHIQSIIDTADDLIQLSEKARQVDDALTTDSRSLEAVEAVEIIENRCYDFQGRFPHAEVSVEAPSTAWIRADERFELVIDNLLENAIEHFDRQSPTIDVSIIPNATVDDRVEVRVADNGPGIPAMEIESVTSGEETPLKHGSGLGLWLVKWLADEYGGELAFENRSPRGSVAIVRLQPSAPPSE